MVFSPGQIVVHPHHGPATVTGIATRHIRGVPAKYLTLEIHSTNLVVGVPVAKADEIGIRPVLDTAALKELFDVLRAPSPKEVEGWSRRFKDNHEKLRLGDLCTTAGVVRDLLRRQEMKGISLGEKDLLKEARRPLVAELALALGITEEQAEDALGAAALEGRVPVLPPALAEAV
jgi:CarD family transcriptional regulator